MGPGKGAVPDVRALFLGARGGGFGIAPFFFFSKLGLIAYIL